MSGLPQHLVLLSTTITYPATSQQLSESVASLAKQASSLMSLLNSTEEIAQGKAARVWLGEGSGSIPKRTYDRMMRWEYIDLAELCQRPPRERMVTEGETEKLIVLPTLEVTKAKKKPISSILRWVECFSRFVAVDSPSERSGKSGEKRSKKPFVCWQFNDGSCTFGRKCKFPHECGLCQGPRPKTRCHRDMRPRQ